MVIKNVGSVVVEPGKEAQMKKDSSEYVCESDVETKATPPISEIETSAEVLFFPLY